MKSLIDRSQVRTLYQTRGYSPDIDLRTDGVIVYGWKKDLPERVRDWRARGYHVHFMTGVAWGGYHEYLIGDFDGRTHTHEAQVAANGERIDHGNEVFYFVPSADYTSYLKHIVERAIDAGAEAIHLEEPEFWVRGGYSSAFKEIWVNHFNCPWQPPHESPGNWYRAAQLKYLIYTSCLEAVFTHAKAYAASNHAGRNLKCYVASHSLINYSQWGIVSPASNLAHLDSCDGYICQVWTGTARTPNHYRGKRAERTFETAYLEYAQMTAMIFSTGRSIWFLADPIEDDPDHDWDDYRTNYQATLVASLLNHEVSTFEVMPWPERVFRSLHPHKAPPEEQTKLPAAYATELLTVIKALSDLADHPVQETPGIGRVALAISDTVLFERGWGETLPERLRQDGDQRPPDQIYRLGRTADAEMDGFYGLAMPLLKRGVQVKIAHLEHVNIADYLKEFDLLILSYDFMKPPTEQVHEGLAEWVRRGGVLLYVGNETPGDFDSVDGWWNRDPHSFAKPVDHLAHILGIRVPLKQSIEYVGKGAYCSFPASAASAARLPDNAARYTDAVRLAYSTGRERDGGWQESPVISVRRGRYLIVACLDEYPGDAKPPRFRGPFVDLLSPGLPVRGVVDPEPGRRYLLYDISQALENEVIAAAGRVESGDGSTDEPFIVTTPEGVHGQLVLHTRNCPTNVRLNYIDCKSGEDPSGRSNPVGWSFDERHRLLRVEYEGSPKGVLISIERG